MPGLKTESWSWNTILADDVGLGKTLTSTMQMLMEDKDDLARITMIVVPKTVTAAQWELELHQYARWTETRTAICDKPDLF